MEYKWLNISDSVSIPVPKGLTPEDEANYIANKTAFMDFEALEAECIESLQLLKEGKLLSFEEVLDKLERESTETPGNCNGQQ